MDPPVPIRVNRAPSVRRALNWYVTGLGLVPILACKFYGVKYDMHAIL